MTEFSKILVMTGDMSYIPDYHKLDRLQKINAIKGVLKKFNLKEHLDYNIGSKIGFCYTVEYSDETIMNPFKELHTQSLLDSVDTRYTAFKICKPAEYFKRMVEHFDPPPEMGIVNMGKSAIFRNVVYYSFTSESAKLEFYLKNANKIIDEKSLILKGIRDIFLD